MMTPALFGTHRYIRELLGLPESIKQEDGTREEFERVRS